MERKDLKTSSTGSLNGRHVRCSPDAERYFASTDRVKPFVRSELFCANSSEVCRRYGYFGKNKSAISASFLHQALCFWGKHTGENSRFVGSAVSPSAPAMAFTTLPFCCLALGVFAQAGWAVLQEWLRMAQCIWVLLEASLHSCTRQVSGTTFGGERRWQEGVGGFEERSGLLEVPIWESLRDEAWQTQGHDLGFRHSTVLLVRVPANNWRNLFCCLDGPSWMSFSHRLVNRGALAITATANGGITSSTAQGGSFKNRKPIGELGCCESGMAERSHWWTERCLISLSLSFFSFSLFLSVSLSFSDYLPTYLLIYLSIYLFISLSIYLPIHLSSCLVF